ncbi:MAG: universal stress protein [Tahibacter sp.]
MRDILVTLGTVDARSGHVNYAVELCTALDAALTALYVSQPFVDMPPIESPALLPEAVHFLREHRRAAVAGGPAFITWAKQRGVRHCEWKIANGSIAAALAELGNWHDLIVSGGVQPSDPQSMAVCGEMLLKAPAACLIVPAGVEWHGMPRRIAVAWNDSPQAIHAISAARPFLDRDSHVIVLSGKSRSDDAASHIVHPGFDLPAYLDRHGYDVECYSGQIDDRCAGESLLAAAADVNADLLVMGAYGRARFSEWVLGGATRHVLQNATLPLLMRH